MMAAPKKKTHPVQRRWKAVCAYDGSRFHGWQSQANAVAVQDVIEEALASVLKKKIRIHGSGRTDTGVHAFNQVFHFDAAWNNEPAQLVRGLATWLPAGVQVKSIVRARADFHSQFDARGKRYLYFIYLGNADPFQDPFCWSIPQPIGFDRMVVAAKVLQGRHDFAAFSALNGDERETTVRDLRRLSITRRGARVRITLEADGFLYKMARSLAGAIVAVGFGRLTIPELRAALKTGERIPAIVTAPARGLFLERVFYS